MNPIKQYLTGIGLCAALIIAGGCSNESDITGVGDGTGNADGTRVPLTIRATAGNFEGLPETDKGDAPQTRTPTESETGTTFSTGDAIGLFAIKDGVVVEDVNNSKLVYDATTKSWSPETGAPLYWHEGDYVAYYPYKEGITAGTAKTADEIIASLAANPALQPTSNQNDPSGTLANYTACDLMTASGTPAAGNTLAEKTLTLKFTHQFALLILEPKVYMKCTAPADAGFVYRPDAKIPVRDNHVKNATINETGACWMSDGTFRVLVKPTSGVAGQITGKYLTTDSKEVSFSGTSIAAGFVAGHCYKVEVTRSAPNTTESVERALERGDFVYHGNSDIEIYPGNGYLLTNGMVPDYDKAVVGMVVTVATNDANNRVTDKECNEKGWRHAYVMGLEDYGGNTNWGKNVEESVIPLTPKAKAKNNMNGYAETEAMLAERANKSDLSSYGTFSALNTYRNKSQNAVPAGLNRSPWFMPSVGQWIDVMVNICGRSPETFEYDNDAGWGTPDYGTEMWDAINSLLNKVGKPLSFLSTNSTISYSCSSQVDASNSWRIRWLKNNLVWVSIDPKKNGAATLFVRPFFAF